MVIANHMTENMQVIIDRFEGDKAVVEIEKGKFSYIAKELVIGAKEGDVISIVIDSTETNERRRKIKKLEDSLFEE